MKQTSLLVAFLLISLMTIAQTGKEFKKSAAEAYKAKNYPKAFLDYKRAAEAYKSEGKTDTALFYNATIAGYKAKKYEDLIPFATKAIELGYEKAYLAYYIKALAYAKTDNDEKYFETLKNGHEDFPNYSKISKKLAKAYLKKGLEPYKKGADIVKEAEPLRESDVDKYNTKLEEAGKKFEEARQIFEKAYEANPKEKQVLKFLLAVYQSLEMEDKAQKIDSELKSM